MRADRLEELAAASVAGGLGSKERGELRRLLRMASQADKARVASILNVGALAALSLPRVQAPPSLLHKLMPRVIQKAKTFASGKLPEGLKFVLQNDDSGWLPLPIPGAYFKILSLDDEKDYAVVLGKLDAGASYPPHTHIGPEEVYVLTGDLSFGDVKLLAGDFQTAAAGSRHDVNRSENGCTILAILSKKDLQAQFGFS